MFEKFTQKFNIRHQTSSPHHQQGDRKAESAVKTAKTLITKANDDCGDAYLAQLAHKKHSPRRIRLYPCSTDVWTEVQNYLAHYSVPVTPNNPGYKQNKIYTHKETTYRQSWIWSAHKGAGATEGWRSGPPPTSRTGLVGLETCPDNTASRWTII